MQSFYPPFSWKRIRRHPIWERHSYVNKHEHRPPPWIVGGLQRKLLCKLCCESINWNDKIFDETFVITHFRIRKLCGQFKNKFGNPFIFGFENVSNSTPCWMYVSTFLCLSRTLLAIFIMELKVNILHEITLTP